MQVTNKTIEKVTRSTIAMTPPIDIEGSDIFPSAARQKYGDVTNRIRNTLSAIKNLELPDGAS
jgi:hypothetical protein